MQARLEQIKAEAMYLLKLESLDGVTVNYNVTGRDKYVSISRNGLTERIDDPQVVDRIAELIKEKFYLENRDDTEELDQEDHLWNS